MPGPAPKPDEQRRRRNAVVAMTKLPERREAPAPDWPLTKPIKLELEAWAFLWTLPQSVAWERDSSARLVARYCRTLVKAENGFDLLLPEVRMLEDRLGLSPMAMLRLRWEVAADEVGAARTAKTPAPRRRTAKRRLMAVDDSPKAG
jgi:hypothetical protein